MAKRTAILFGSSGLVGSHLLETLIKDEAYDVILLFNRRPVRTNSPKIREFITDLSDLKNIESNLNGDDLFCCLGTTIKKAKTRDAFRKVDFGLPVALAEIASRKPVKRFVVISSIGASADSGNFYLHTKGEMELELVRILGQKAVIVRPSLILGKRSEYRFSEEAGKWFARILSPLLIGGLARYKAIQASDIACAMRWLALHGSEEQVVESDQLQKFSKLYHHE